MRGSTEATWPHHYTLGEDAIATVPPLSLGLREVMSCSDDRMSALCAREHQLSFRFDKLLILDIDETLIHAREKPLPDRPADFVGPFYVYKRPHVDCFLATCFTWLEVGVWTSASRDYAAWILRQLLPDPSRLAFIWAHEHCLQRYDHERHRHFELKPLKKLKRKSFARGRYSLSKMIVVDDTPATFGANYGNGIRIAEYRGGPDDVELLLLLKYLESIGDASDVRAIEKRGWRSKARLLAGVC